MIASNMNLNPFKGTKIFTFERKVSVVRYIVSFIGVLLIGALLIGAQGEDPVNAAKLIVKGAFVSYKTVNIEFFKQFPVLDMLFNNSIGMVYLAFVIAAVAIIVMYKTPFGLRLRGVGINPTAAQSAGINVRKYRWICLLIMGAMMGLAGSYMPLSGSSMFTERMTDGRGFLCLTAILVGRADPFRTMLLAMLFGYSSALTLVLSSYGLPSQILSMLPYLMVMAVLLITGIKKYRGIDISSEAI